VKKPIVYCLLLLLAACSNRTGIPKNIIPPDSMQKILKDVIMTSEYSSLYLGRDSLKKDKVKANQDLLEAVFQIHHISKENFVESLHFYESRPDLNKKIFDSLSAYANRKRQELFAPKPLAKPAGVPLK
jgi:hypothetical protein